jgi:hypothetical protein
MQKFTEFKRETRLRWNRFSFNVKEWVTRHCLRLLYQMEEPLILWRRENELTTIIPNEENLIEEGERYIYHRR